MSKKPTYVELLENTDDDDDEEILITRPIHSGVKYEEGEFITSKKEMDIIFLDFIDKLQIFIETLIYITLVSVFFLVITIIYDVNKPIQPIWDTITKNILYIVIISIINTIIGFVALMYTIFEKRNLFCVRLWIYIWIASLLPYGLFLPSIASPLKIYIILGSSYACYVLIWAIPLILDIFGVDFVDRLGLKMNHERINSFRSFVTFVLIVFLLFNIMQFIFTYSIMVFIQVNITPFIVIIISFILHVLEIIDIFNVNYYKGVKEKRPYIITKIFNLLTINLTSIVIIIIGFGLFLTNQNFRLSWFGVVPAKKYESNTKTTSEEDQE